MTYNRRYEVRRAFSLLELLIVILLVSIVYFLGFEGIEIGTKKPKALTPLNLKSNILSSDLYSGKTTLLCVDGCHSCYLRRDITSGFEVYESPVDLAGIQAYTLDQYESLVPVEYGRYQDQKICLVMDFFENGSSTQIILKDGEDAYFLPAFFGEPKSFASLQEAKNHWLRNATLLSDSGAFY